MKVEKFIRIDFIRLNILRLYRFLYKFLRKDDLITSIEQLDERLQRIEEAGKISDDAMRAEFRKFYMKFPYKLPKDPYSSLYAAAQFKMYEELTGKIYKASNEITKFNVENAIKFPFPFSTQSKDTVGRTLMVVGHIIKNLEHKPPASILEFGPGWGNTTIALARMGYQVTAVDIDQKFLDLITARSRSKSLNIRTIRSDFLDVDFSENFDIILFYKCFHHCSNHIALIKKMDSWLAENGQIIFAAEPITETLPMPWGIRLDGESLWAIRQNGWLELGFQESYFMRTMKNHGFIVKRKVNREEPFETLFIAKKDKRK